MDLSKVLAMAGAFLLYVVFAEFRVKKAKGKTQLAQEEVKDEKIEKRASVLSDPELDALLSKDLGRSKPNP